MTQKAQMAGLQKAVTAAVKRLAELEKKNAKLEKDLEAARKKASAATARKSATKSEAAEPEPNTEANVHLHERLVELEQQLSLLVEA